MPLSATEQAYFDHARQALPRFLFASSTSAQEVFAAFAVLWGDAHAQIDAWRLSSYILDAAGVYLDQHARDRGTSRIDGESDAVLRERLRAVEDAVTRPALMAGVERILAIESLSGAGMVELRHECAFAGQSYASRGDRAGSERPHYMIVILPYSTTPETGAAVAEYLRARKAAGYRHLVEISEVVP
jgi:hypothetical protein